MQKTPTEQTIEQFLADRGSLWPPTAIETAEHTGYSLATVYTALRTLGAVKTRRGKNQFGYLLPTPSEIKFPSVEETLGTVEGKPWRHVAMSTMRVVSDAASLADHITPAEYAEGFEALGYRFLELAAHAAAAQERPDWKIVLGFDTDTEQE